MPILLWPFPSGGPAPVILTPTGKVFIFDTINNYFFGPPPFINESCSMVINLGPGLPRLGTSVQFFFTKPDGTSHQGDPDFSFINPITIRENFPLQGFPAGQSVSYTFADDELNILGRWSVYVLIGGYRSSIVSFAVLPLPQA